MSAVETVIVDGQIGDVRCIARIAVADIGGTGEVSADPVDYIYGLGSIKQTIISAERVNGEYIATFLASGAATAVYMSESQSLPTEVSPRPPYVVSAVYGIEPMVRFAGGDDVGFFAALTKASSIGEISQSVHVFQANENGIVLGQQLAGDMSVSTGYYIRGAFIADATVFAGVTRSGWETYHLMAVPYGGQFTADSIVANLSFQTDLIGVNATHAFFHDNYFGDDGYCLRIRAVALSGGAVTTVVDIPGTSVWPEVSSSELSAAKVIYAARSECFIAAIRNTAKIVRIGAGGEVTMQVLPASSRIFSFQVSMAGPPPEPATGFWTDIAGAIQI